MAVSGIDPTASGTDPTATEQLLGRLVAHPSESRSPNRALIEEIAERCAAIGGRATLVDGRGGVVTGEHPQVNLLVAFGPDEPGGVMLSGHSDVVPAGTGWSSDPYVLTPIDDERLAGRGTADMKGFIASAVCAFERWVGGGGRFERPVRLALSFDEEIGCVGVRGLLEHLTHQPHLVDAQPELVLIGEPSMMRPRHRHLGKLGYDAVVRSEPAHSSLSYRVPNAIAAAARIIAALDDVGRAALRRVGSAGESTEVPARRRTAVDSGTAGDSGTAADSGTAVDSRTAVDCGAAGDWGAAAEPDVTVNAGVIDGGTGLNVVAERCRFTFELRNAYERDPDAELAPVWAAVDTERARLATVGGGIDVVETVRYPALAADTSHPLMRLVERLADAGPFTPIGFGTEGGLFATALGAPVAICGPGDITVAHRPDEYVTRSQLARCDLFLDALLTATASPVGYRHRS